MGIARSAWGRLRKRTARVRHRLTTAVRGARSVQRGAPLAPEDRVYKRKRQHVLVDLVHEHCAGQDVRFAEIGCNQADVSAHLVQYCSQVSHCVAIDIRPLLPQSPVHGLSKVQFVQGRTERVAADFEDASFDIIFIDGDHSAKGVHADLESWVPKVKPGGVIAGHDYGSHTHVEVKPTVDAFFREQGYPAPVNVDANRVFWILKR